ncbi:hypothetical protein [Galbibacter sp. PAP.153]|uniref:hypothetical protein n=1 Tax=Galbibacter sp. PAP.153 TaxID=3104623 RepID=UPI00300BAFC3
MRRIYPIATLFFIVFYCSCSSSESISEELLAEIGSENYFPLEKNNHWTYNIEAETSAKDSVWVEKDSLIEGEIYYQAKGNTQKKGFFTNLISSSLVVKSKNKLFLDGNISQLIPGLEIPVHNLVLLDIKSPLGGELYTNSGISTYEYNKYILHIEYTVSTKTEAVLNDYTLFDETYNNVIKTSLTVNIKGILTTDVDGYELTIPVIKDQDAIISTQYFAPGIGLIYNEAAIAYQLSNLDQLEGKLPFPTEYSEVITQSIEDFSILN